jgi:hypothetical protein
MVTIQEIMGKLYRWVEWNTQGKGAPALGPMLSLAAGHGLC